MDYEGIFHDLHDMKLRAIRERNAAQEPRFGYRNGDRWYELQGFIQECSNFQDQMYNNGKARKLDLNQ